MVGHTRTLFWPGWFRRAAFLSFGLIIGLAAVVTPTVSAQAAGPPITDPNDSRCLRVDPENLFFINLQTPPSGQAIGPGSTVGSWFSDESGLNTNSQSPGLPFHIVFRMTGPSVSVDLLPDVSETSNQNSVFNNAHKECKIQTNIKSKIPSKINGNPLPAGSYTVTLTAFDNDQTRNPGPDMGTQTWHFSIAAQVAPASPTPAGGTAGAGTVGGAGSPASGQQVLGAITTVPSLPNTGHQADPSRPDWAMIGVLLSLGALAGIAIRRRLKPAVLSR